ncbi:MAG TPA: molybdate ABC transporter permease subunit [Kofleriaceae bacterium]|nr:molybdate ABC transporter permease subunit [Kofleriaceae bacterium]
MWWVDAVDWAPLWLSLQIASLSTVVTLIFGTGFSLLLAWRKLPARHLIDAVVSAPLVLPPTVLGYYLLVVLGRNSVIGRGWDWLFGTPIVFTFTGAVIAASVGSLPLVVRSIRLGIESVEPTLVAAARTLGARPVRVVATVVLPLAAPGLVAGAMLGFARALGDYGATQMLAGARIDGTPTASIFVMDQLLANHDDQVFAMSLATTIVGVTLLYFANRLTHRLHHHRV